MEITHLNLDSHQLNFCMGAINRFGSGQHPVASAMTINGFKAKYLVQCLDKAIKKNVLTEKGIETVNAIKAIVEKTKELVTWN